MQNLHSEVFELAKHKFHFLLSTIKISFNPCIFVATDMWGPSNISNISRIKSFIIFIDDFIDDCTRVFFSLKTNPKLVLLLCNLCHWLKINLGWLLRNLGLIILQIINHTLDPLFFSKGKDNSWILVYITLQQSEVTERNNGHLLKQSRATIFQNYVPKRIVRNHSKVTYLINKLSSIVL